MKQIWIIAAFVMLATLMPACDSGKRQSAETKGHQVVVQTLRPQRITYSTELSGRVTSFQVAEVRPQVSGILQKRLFEEGADIQEGQPLYQIDPASYEAELDSAQAALLKAEANVTPARLKAERFRELLATRAVSRQEYDDAQAVFRQAEAEVGVKNAAVRNARIQLDRTRVRAPISGRIGKSSFTPGALVTANQAQYLTTVRQLDPVYVDIVQPSQELLRLRLSLPEGIRDLETLPVRLRLENGTVYPHEGRLQFADVSVDESTGMVALRALFPNPDMFLLPGMYLRAVLDESVDEEALLVSQRALRRDPSGKASVLVVLDSNRVEERPVRVGRTVGTNWQVLSGLEAGERIVVEGRVSPGMTVSVRE